MLSRARSDLRGFHGAGGFPVARPFGLVKYHVLLRREFFGHGGIDGGIDDALRNELFVAIQD